MSLIQLITRLLKNGEETSENHKDRKLRTRYYKKRRAEMMELVQLTIQKKLAKWKIIHVDKGRGEIMVEKSEAVGVSDIGITVFEISPIRSAIDVHSSLRSFPGDFGTSQMNIVKFFDALHTGVQPEQEKG